MRNGIEGVKADAHRIYSSVLRRCLVRRQHLDRNRPKLSACPGILLTKDIRMGPITSWPVRRVFDTLLVDFRSHIARTESNYTIFSSRLPGPQTCSSRIRILTPIRRYTILWSRPLFLLTPGIPKCYGIYDPTIIDIVFMYAHI